MIFSFFIIQPLFSAQPDQVNKECSSKRQCPFEKKKSDKNECSNNGCNPFMPCVYGNFYLPVKGISAFAMIRIKRDKLFSYDDNRLSSKIYDCWHPPEVGYSLS